MRGKTAKKLRKFVKVLIENTSEEEKGNKSFRKLYKEMKINWYVQGRTGQKFVDYVIAGNLSSENK